MTYAVLLVAVIVVAGFVYKKKQSPRKRPDDSAKRQRAPVPRFAGVQLVTGKGPCSAARELAGRQLLASEASALPLRGCTQVACNCSYRKVAERRQIEARRSSDLGIEPVLFSGKERREAFDRRSLF